jgi:HD superfamily phosphohydrolase
MAFKIIYDKYHGNIEFSEFENFFLKSSILNRLHRILQNSTAYLVFPCSKTSRFEHSIGTMQYTSSLFTNGINNSKVLTEYLQDKENWITTEILELNPENIFDIPNSSGGMEISSLMNTFIEGIGNDNFLNAINQVEYYKHLRHLVGDEFLIRNLSIKNENENIKSSAVIILMYQAIRIHGLLHDLGHLPFSHLFEFSIESIWDKLRNETEPTKFEKKVLADLENSLLNTSQPYEQKSEIHELITEKIIRFIFAEIKHEINTATEDPKEKSVKIFWVYLIERIWGEIRNKHGQFSSLYKIVSGSIDADRLDYIQRDGEVSGIVKTSSNLDRIIKTFCLCRLENNESKDKYAFLPSIQSIHDIEQVLYDRFNIYKFMVNHHAVKRSDSLLQIAIEKTIFEELKQNGNDSRSSNNYTRSTISAEQVVDLISVFNEISSTNFNGNFARVLYRFTQFTDHWLLSLLSRKYIDLINNGGGEFNEQKSLLSEIYESRRHFKSLWKIPFEFNEFVLSVGEYVDVFLKANPQKLPVDAPIAAKQIFDQLTVVNIKAELLIKENDQKEKYFLNLGHLLIDYLLSYYKNSNFTVRMNRELESDDFYAIVAPCRLKTGINNQLLVDFKSKSKVVMLSKISNIEQMLSNELKESVKFFVYFTAKKRTIHLKECCIIEKVQKGIHNLFENSLNN